MLRFYFPKRSLKEARRRGTDSRKTRKYQQTVVRSAHLEWPALCRINAPLRVETDRKASVSHCPFGGAKKLRWPTRTAKMSPASRSAAARLPTGLGRRSTTAASLRHSL